MKGGANKKSRHQLELAGTARKDRHGQAESDVFSDGVPTMPENLSDTAKKVWNRLMPELKSANHMKKAFEPSFAGFCALYGEFLDSPMEFPASRHGQLRLYIQELGLGPVASTRLLGKEPSKPQGGDFSDV